MLDLEMWAAAPFHLWSVVFFVMGAMVGSLLNVCIYRMPRGESIVSPPSHCPHCGYSIPWYLNMPIVTWTVLKGRCANCQEPISPRYLLVEALTGLMFLASWLAYGERAAGLAVVYCLFLAGLIVATFIDLEHFIIPDEITLGGLAAGFLLSAVVPAMHADLFTGEIPEPAPALKRSFFGLAVGGGVVYAILRAGKLAFGRQRFELPPGSKVVFTETALELPDQTIPYEELFYRASDWIALEARTVQIEARPENASGLTDRCYFNTRIRLSPSRLEVGEDRLDPEEIPRMEVETDEIVVPREAMGFGDVKFMAAIGAFLGWPAVLFSLMVSAVVGSVVGVALILLGKQEWSGRLPYGPYIAFAAALWIFGGREFVVWWLTPAEAPF